MSIHTITFKFKIFGIPFSKAKMHTKLIFSFHGTENVLKT